MKTASFSRLLLSLIGKRPFLSLIILLAGLASGRCESTVAIADPSATTPHPVPPPSSPPLLGTNELQQLVEPIALHPDPLIAIVLPASVYPLEIVQAARFVKDTNNIPKLDDQKWDDNVKDVARFPELIAMMDKDISWTMELGDAFVEQPEELMGAIQTLRAKAKNAGTLQTTPQQIVSVTNIIVMQTNVQEVTTVTKQIVQIEPANPQVIYVPTYTRVVYYPPPYYVYNPYAPLIAFSAGVAWGFYWGNRCNWSHGHVHVKQTVNINRNINRNVNKDINRGRDRPQAGTMDRPWQPDKNRRERTGSIPSTREARGWSGSSSTRPSTGNLDSRPSTGVSGNRPSTGTVGNQPSTGTASQRPSTGNAGNRPSTGTSATRPSTGSSGTRTGTSGGSGSAPPGGSAYGPSNNAGSARGESSRGSASRNGGGAPARGSGARR